MLADKKYIANEIYFDFAVHPRIFDKLANRLQLWKLTHDGKEKYFALGHFPFAGDEHATEKASLSTSGNLYCDLINNLISRYVNEHLVICADFNFNPYLLKQWKDRALDQITNNNSILLTIKEKSHKQIDTVTVDGILLSAKEKQKHYTSRQPNSSLFSMLIREYGLFKSSFRQHLEENRQQNGQSQNEYDKRLGLTACT